MERIVHISNFDKGLVTNVDQGDLPLNSMVKLQNVRNDKPGMLRGVPGFVKFADLPSTIEGDVRHFQEIVVNDTQILIVWGIASSVQHFYYSTDTGSTWIEITEMVFCEVASATSASKFIVRADGSAPFNETPSTTDSAYVSWFLYFHDAGTPANDSFGHIRIYTGSTAEITLSEDLDGTPVADDKIILMRFPLWNIGDLQDLGDGTLSNFNDHRNFVRDSSNFKPTIIQRFNSVAIYTGRKKDNLSIGINNHSNLWFGFIDTQKTNFPKHRFFVDSQLDYSDYHCERKLLDRPSDANLISSLVAVSSSDDDLDAATYGVMLSFLYDEEQESPIYFDNSNLIPSAQKQAIVSGEHLNVVLSWDGFATDNEFEFHFASRRISHLRIYLAQVEEVDTSPSLWRPTSPLFFVKQVDLLGTGSGWGGAPGGPYTQTVSIFGADWKAGLRLESELVHGYFSRIRVNADLGATVNGREVGASLVLSEKDDITLIEDKSALIYSPINSANKNTPDALPESDIKDMSEHGIYEIFNIQPLNNLLAVFGEKKLVILDGTEEEDSYEQRGVNGFWSVVSKGEKLFWGNLDSMYELVQGGRPNEIGFPIRGDWQGISAANRKTSIAVYDNKFNTFILHSPDGTTYIYDESRKSWRTYSSSTTFEWFSIGVDGEVLATDKTDIFHLFPDSGSTETLTGTVEWILDFEDYASIKFIEIMYKLTGVITVKVFDLEKSDSYHIAEVKFFVKTEFDNESQKLSFRAKKIRLQLTIVPTAASNFNYEIDSISLHGTKNIQENQ